MSVQTLHPLLCHHLSTRYIQQLHDWTELAKKCKELVCGYVGHDQLAEILLRFQTWNYQRQWGTTEPDISQVQHLNIFLVPFENKLTESWMIKIVFYGPYQWCQQGETRLWEMTKLQQFLIWILDRNIWAVIGNNLSSPWSKIYAAMRTIVSSLLLTRKCSSNLHLFYY